MRDFLASFTFKLATYSIYNSHTVNHHHCHHGRTILYPHHIHATVRLLYFHAINVRGYSHGTKETWQFGKAEIVKNFLYILNMVA